VEKAIAVLDSCNVLLIFQGKSAHPAVFSLRSFDFLPPTPPPPPPTPTLLWLQSKASCQNMNETCPSKTEATKKKIAKYGKYALIKKKIKFSSYIRKFRVEQLQSHI
jgi:hypothetical protein